MGSKTINELTLKLNADMAELKSQLTNVKAELKNFQNSFTSIGVAIKKAFAIDSFNNIKDKIIQLAKDIFNVGGQLAGVKTAFDAMNQPGLLDKLREATKGTISDLSLMKGAVKANEFNIPVEKMGIMMQFASMQAQKMGESVDYMAESITTGLARGSVLILDNLGLSSKQLNEEMKKTGDISTAAFNIMNQRLQEGGGYIETASTMTARWGARWENIKGQIGLFINEALVRISPYLEEIWAWFGRVLDAAVKFVIETYNGFADLYNESMAFRMLVESIGMTFKTIWATIKLFFNLMVDNLKNTGKLLAYVLNPMNYGKDFGKGLQEIFFKGGKEVIDDFSSFGKNVKTAFNEGLESVKIPMEHWKPGKLSTGGNGGGKIPAATDDGKQSADKIKAWQKGITTDLEVFNDQIKMDMDGAAAAFDFDVDLPIDNINEKFEEVKPIMSEFQTFLQGWHTSVMVETDLMSQSVGSAFEMIGNGIADALTGGSLQGVLSGFIGILADFASNLGKQMIAIGVAGMALKIAFKNPATAIAAGVALVALGALIKKVQSKQPKFASGGIVPGSNYSGDRVPILANSGEMVLNAGQQTALFKQLNGGAQAGGGILSARVSGNDLLFILDNARKKQGLAY